MSCGLQAKIFGAYYEDGICIDGEMYDLDSCEVPGGPLTSGGIPCPRCNPRAFAEYWGVGFPGNARQRRKKTRLVRRLTMDSIGRNARPEFGLRRLEGGQK